MRLVSTATLSRIEKHNTAWDKLDTFFNGRVKVVDGLSYDFLNYPEKGKPCVLVLSANGEYVDTLTMAKAIKFFNL